MLLRQIDPQLFEFIEWITEGIKKFGTATAKKYSRWGDTSDFDSVRNQKILETFFTEDELPFVKAMEADACGTDCGPGTLKGMQDY